MPPKKKSKEINSKTAVVYFIRELGKDDWLHSKVTNCESYDDAKKYIENEVDLTLINLDSNKVSDDKIFSITRDEKHDCVYITRTEITITYTREIVEQWQIVFNVE